MKTLDVMVRIAFLIVALTVVLAASKLWTTLDSGAVPLRVEGPVPIAPEPVHLFIHAPERP